MVPYTTIAQFLRTLTKAQISRSWITGFHETQLRGSLRSPYGLYREYKGLRVWGAGFQGLGYRDYSEKCTLFCINQEKLIEEKGGGQGLGFRV